MTETILCPQCEVVEMEFQQRLKNGKTKEGSYRRRKFKCPVCGISEVVYASGGRYIEPYQREVENRLSNDRTKKERNRKIVSEHFNYKHLKI